MKTKNNSIYEKNPLLKNPTLLDPPEKSIINKTVRGEGAQKDNGLSKNNYIQTPVSNYQESQSIEFMEQRVDLIINEATKIESDFNPQGDNNLDFEKKMEELTAKIQGIFDSTPDYLTTNYRLFVFLKDFGLKQEQLDNWLRETLSSNIQNTLSELMNRSNILEEKKRERTILQNQTSQALQLAVSVQKFLKQNQELWNDA